MSQHSQRTHQGPSITGIAAGAACTVISLAATVYTATGEVTAQEMTGSILGVLLTALLLAQTAALASARAETRARLLRAAQAAAKSRLDNTGTWKGASLGQVLSVRYEPETGRFHVEGWITDTWVIQGERQWTDVPTLAEIIAEIERDDDMRPVADLATDHVRARLGLGEYVAPVPPPVWPPVDPARRAAFDVVEAPIAAPPREAYPSALATSDAFGPPEDADPGRAYVPPVRGGDGRSQGWVPAAAG